MTVKLNEIARRLRDAYTQGPIDPLLSELPASDVEQAYQVQTLNTQYWQSKGRRIVGRKIGLTAPAVQAQLGVDQPDFGVLFADMAIEDGGELAPSQVLQAKVEAEVALVMGRDLRSSDATLHDVASATAYVLPAIEIVDSRIKDWKIRFADTVADNASSAFYVLGSEPRPLVGLDLRTCGMVLEVNAKIVSFGVGTVCMGHPLLSAAWLVRTLARFDQGLKAGDVVLTGALGPMVTLRPGDIVRTSIGGIGSTSFTFREKL